MTNLSEAPFAVVTGASIGIGYELAAQFLANGFDGSLMFCRIQSQPKCTGNNQSLAQRKNKALYSRPAALLGLRQFSFIRLISQTRTVERKKVMDQLKELLVDELRDLLNAETQIVKALPSMARAAHSPALRGGLEKHLHQTETHVERLNTALGLLDREAEPKPCKGMSGIIDEGRETIEELKDKDDLESDLGLIAAAQKVEHYEIASYGTARCLARQIGQREVSKLLSQTLGEEESTDYLLSELAKPLLQRACAEVAGEGSGKSWGEPDETAAETPRRRPRSQATVGETSYRAKKSKK